MLITEAHGRERKMFYSSSDPVIFSARSAVRTYFCVSMMVGSKVFYSYLIKTFLVPVFRHLLHSRKKDEQKIPGKSRLSLIKIEPFSSVMASLQP